MRYDLRVFFEAVAVCIFFVVFIKHTALGCWIRECGLRVHTWLGDLLDCSFCLTWWFVISYTLGVYLLRDEMYFRNIHDWFFCIWLTSYVGYAFVVTITEDLRRF